MRKQFKAVLGHGQNGCLSRWVLLGVLALTSRPAPAAAPDLTAAGVIAGIDSRFTYSLGPTGMRGWLYRDGANVGDMGTMTAQQPWQILVTAVGTNTPAAGFLEINDVLLGVSTGAGNLPVPLFTADARKSIGWAIGAAEAGDGVMNLKRWRAGVTDDVSIHLQLMGAYSATAPYDCPKSALILSNACAIIANRSFNAGGPGNPVLGLALLASGNPAFLPKAQAYALSVATNLVLNPTACDAWGWGYKNVFLSEYYLLTGDTNVLHGISDYAVNLAKAQSMYGTFGHGGAQLTAAGGYHGSISWYGPVNQAGLIANLGIVMGRKALVAGGLALDAEIDPAIGRAAKFFGYFVGKGGIPYGEHEPGNGHNSNGKDSSSAVMFALMGNQPEATEFFTRMSVAGYNGREYGHTGQGFSYLWSALGAQVGGTNALVSYLAPVRWHLDLSRRCDGTFVYDGGEQYGGSEVYDYWGSAIYAGIDPTASYVLTYSLPKRQLYITGKNADPANWLSSAVVSNAIWAGAFSQLCAGYTTNQLIAAMGEYDPVVRSWAADTLGKTNVSVSVLTGMAGSANSLLREAACQALGVKKDTGALAVLGQRLTDPDIWVRSKAAKALQNFGSAALPQLTTMLTAFTNNATDPHVIVWDDPIQISNGYLADELFNTLGASTINASTNLLYPAVRAGLHQPDGRAVSYLSGFIQNRLSLIHVQAVAPSLVAAIAERSPADQMFSDDIRYAGLKTLAKYKIEEGIPLCLMVKEQTWHGDNWAPFDYLAIDYRGAARDALPTLYAWQAHLPEFARDSSVTVGTRLADITSHIASTIAAIENDASPPTLVNFKRVTSARALPPGISLPSASNVLSVAVSDIDGGVPAYAWSKVSGAGNVVFNPGGITQSTNCTAAFDTPGTYVLRVAAVDSSILNSGLWITHNLGYYDFQTYTNVCGAVLTNVTVTVNPDSNRAPVPQNQSVTTAADTAKAVTLAAADTNGDAVTFSIVTPPAHGTLSGAAPNVTYTPAAGYTGFDSFTFTASDGRADSAAATVTVDVGAAGNRRPAATNQFVTATEDAAKAIILTGSDPDGDPLMYTILTLPANGTLSGSAPGMTYTPATNVPAGNFSGSDSFTFSVSDGALTSAAATVSIRVTPVNDPPQVFSQGVSVSANTASAITLEGLDPEGYALRYAVAGAPGHGALSGVAPDLTYRPATNYHGPDSFTFTVTDSEGAVSSAAAVSITVVNDPPVAVPQYVEVTPNVAKAITLAGSDTCNDPLTYTVLNAPANGVLSGTAPSVVYTPSNNYAGLDSFTFKVNDGTQDSASPATVSLNVVQWQSWTNTAAGNWSDGAHWAGGAAPAAGGGSDCQLVFSTNVYGGASVDDLSGTFRLSRLTFGSALPGVALSGNALSFTNHAVTLPQLKQESAAQMTLSNAVTLAADTLIGGSGSGPLTFAGVVSGVGGLLKTTSGTLTLGGAGVNTFRGGTTVSAGTLALNANRFNLGPGTLALAGGSTFYTLNFEGNSSGGALTNTFTLSGGAVTLWTAKDIWITGPVTGPGGLTITGSGRTPGVMLSGAKTFSGGVKLSPVIGATPMVSIDNLASLGTGTLRCELTSSDIGAANLRATANLTASPGVANTVDLAAGSRLVVMADGANSLWLSGAITNAGSLVKSGTATLTLSGVNTYSGATRVAGGTLACSSAASLGSGTLDISAGAKVQLNYIGTRYIAGLTFNAGAAQPGGTYGSSASPAANTNNTYFSGTGTVTLGAGGQTVTFGALPAKTYGDAPFALTATASSGLPVSYVSSDPAVASVSGSTVTILKAGTTVITASQAGGTGYDAATPVGQPLTVNKREALLSGKRTYDGTAAVTAADLEVLNKAAGDDLALSGGATLADKNSGLRAFVNESAAPARVRSAAGCTSGAGSTSLTVTLGAAPANGNTLVAVISTRGTASGRVSGISQAGAAWSRASQAANVNGTTAEIWYAPGVSGTAATLTVNLAASLCASAVVMEYSGVLSAGALDQAAGATGSGGAAVTGTTPATAQANELWVGGIGLSGSAYTLGSVLNGFASVTNAQTASGAAAGDANVYALERIANASGAAASGGAVSGPQAAAIAQRGSATTAQWSSGSTLTINKPAGVVAGDVLIVCIAQCNSSGTPSAATLSGWNLINSGTLGGNSRSYGTILSKVAGSSEGSSYGFALVGTVGGAVGDIVAFSGVDNTTPVDAVATTLSPSTGRSITVSAATINTLTDNAAAIMFGMTANSQSGSGETWSAWSMGLNATPLFSNIGAGTVNNDTSVAANWKMIAIAGSTGAGQATVSLSEYNAGIWVALRPAALPSQWSGAVATFKAATSSSLALSGAASANYTLTSLSGALEITPKALTVTGAAVAGKAYDGTVAATLTGGALLAAEASGAGSAADGKPYEGDAVALALSGTFAAKDAGTGIAVTLGPSLTGAQKGNYTLTQPAGLAGDITARALTVTAADQSKRYGQTLTFGSGSTQFTSSGLQNGETIGSVTLSCAGGGAEAAEPAYPITPGAATGGTFAPDNYAISYVNGTLTVTAPTTFLAEDFEHEWADNALATATNGWAASGGADRSIVTNPAAGYDPFPDRCPFPLAYDHAALRRVLWLDTQGDALSTPAVDAEFSSRKVYVDLAANFKVCESLPAAPSANTNAKAAFILLADGAVTNLCVFHGQRGPDGFGLPVFTAIANGIAPGAWSRLTVVFDATTNGAGAEAFRVQVNGRALVSEAAYSDSWKTRIFTGSYAPDGGSWFLSAARRTEGAGSAPSRVGSLVFQGTGSFDDVVVTYTPPDFSRGTVFLLALSDRQ